MCCRDNRHEENPDGDPSDVKAGPVTYPYPAKNIMDLVPCQLRASSSKRPSIPRTAIIQSEPEGPWTTGARWRVFVLDIPEPQNAASLTSSLKGKPDCALAAGWQWGGHGTGG